MTDGIKSPRAGIDFEPVKLVAEVNKAFNGLHFTIQAVQPPKDYPENVKASIAAKDAAEKRGAPFDHSPFRLARWGSASFVHCDAEDTQSKAESGRPFVISR